MERRVKEEKLVKRAEMASLYVFSFSACTLSLIYFTCHIKKFLLFLGFSWRTWETWTGRKAGEKSAAVVTLKIVINYSVYDVLASVKRYMSDKLVSLKY